MSKLSFAVVGAGPGGASMAVLLKKAGCPVTLYDKNTELIRQLNTLETLLVTGKLQGEEKPDLITSDIALAVADADVIMVCTTTDGHRDVAGKIAPHLKNGQILVLNPGHTGGCLEVRNVLQNAGCTADIYVAETTDLLYSCRRVKVGEYFHSGVKSAMKLAALPAGDTDYVLQVLNPYFPLFYKGSSVLETGLENLGALLHPIPTLMNLNKIDSQIPWDYYIEGITPNIAKMVEQADREKTQVAKALGLEITSLNESLRKTYGIEKDSLYEIIQANKAYIGVKSPMNLNHRFIVEDTLCGTVPIASIGKTLGIETPLIDGIIAVASIVLERDFMKEGRTAQKLGLSGKTAEEIRKLVL